MNARASLLALALFVPLGCLPPAYSIYERPLPPGGVLMVRGALSDSVLWVDGKMIGELGDYPEGVRLPPGEHLIEIRHERYHTRYFEIRLADGEVRAVEVTLAEVLD
ncbi:MAG: hypothetical protein HY698_13745 [Deltaproteobacteria bacterium]|nr:hypothetical protein [Deltaproteobacteria bacterium]